jgi:hypothetical protein
MILDQTSALDSEKPSNFRTAQISDGFQTNFWKNVGWKVVKSFYRKKMREAQIQVTC